MKFRKSFIKIIGIIPIVIILFFAYLMVAYSPKYIIGYFSHLTPKAMGNYQNYPTKEIKNSNKVFHFKKNINEDYIESLFNYKFRILLFCATHDPHLNFHI